MNKTEAIKNFLDLKARPDLAALYTPSMEVQVNVFQGNGERVSRMREGSKWIEYTDGNQTWKNFRIPREANSNPNYTDHPIKFDLVEHADGIGLTGWDWENQQSIYFAYDFDAILGHSEKHQAKLSDVQLEAVQRAAHAIPWVEIRKSTSGNGLHLYVRIDPIHTKTHTEHSALAKAILYKMSALTGFNFLDKVDNCGGVMWIWHKKFERAGGVEGEGLRLIKEGEVLKNIPVNWRDYILVQSGKRTKNIPKTIEVNDSSISDFEQFCSRHQKIPLDDGHIALLKFLDTCATSWSWDQEHHMLICHTYALKQAHETLNCRGLFDTVSTQGAIGDQNCYAFPMRDGAWVVRRYTPGVQEAPTWDIDNSGWTRCYFNKTPDLKLVAITNNAAEAENGAFLFNTALEALTTAKTLGVKVDLSPDVHLREAALKAHKDGRLIFEISRNTDDNPATWRGWVNKKTKWLKIFPMPQTLHRDEKEIVDHDELIRHLVCDKGDAGWTLNVGGEWKEENSSNIRLALKALGNMPLECDLIMGKAVLNRWELVNKPFQPEYLGDRQWNRDAAQLAVAPNRMTDRLNYPTWEALLDHCGANLTDAILKNPWCAENNIKTGGEYLFLWIASLFQEPLEPLPYIFFYGPQGSGKSIFHEALSLLIIRGVMRADAALVSQNGFNGELASAILCIVEETDLRQHRSVAYNRIKDWVTGKTINIHVKGLTPYPAINSTHWIQCSNDIEACPIFPGDTRITMCRVDALDPGTHVPKTRLLHSLKKEAEDFLGAIFRTQLHKANDRLNIPVIETDDKLAAAAVNQNAVEMFIEENCHLVKGEMISISDFWERFRNWISRDELHHWSKQKVTRSLPAGVVKGRCMREGARHYYGNISWDPVPQRNPTLISVEDKLVEMP